MRLILESIIRMIPQYRLYATSLLFLYDGATQDEIDSLDEESGIKYSPDVRVKIVDFAHAITDLHAPDVISAPFPPSHPKLPDMGYLKGLYSLKTYFKKYDHPAPPPIYFDCLLPRFLSPSPIFPCVSHDLFGLSSSGMDGSGIDYRIWKEIKGDEDIFEGTRDKSFRTQSSTAQTPFIRVDPFHSDEEMRVAKIRRALNEVAVEDKADEIQDTEDDWSDVSV